MPDTFATDIRRAGRETPISAARDAIMALSRESIRKLVMGSPVGDPMIWKVPRWPKGYEPGTFRANWHVSYGSPSASTTSAKDTSGRATIDACTAQLAALNANPFQRVFICNALPYAMALEHGHSTQAPGPAAIVGKAYASLSVKYSARFRITP